METYTDTENNSDMIDLDDKKNFNLSLYVKSKTLFLVNLLQKVMSLKNMLIIIYLIQEYFVDVHLIKFGCQ